MTERSTRVSARPKPGPRRPRGAVQPRSVNQPKAVRRSEHGVSKRRTGTHEKAPGRGSAPARAQKSPRPPVDRATNRRWWLGVGLFTIVAFLFALLEAPAFEASQTQINGHARTNEGAIVAALQISDDQALLTYDTDAAAQRVAELPWVEHVEVIRQWPSTARVVIRERAVRFGLGDRTGLNWFVVGEDRVAIESRSTPPTGVPLIVAADPIMESVVLGEPIDGVARVVGLVDGLPEQLDSWVSLWSIDDDGVVRANLVGSAEAVFGPAGDSRTQFVSLASILNGGTPLACIRTIDLSTPDTPVINRDPACVLASQELQ